MSVHLSNNIVKLSLGRNIYTLTKHIRKKYHQITGKKKAIVIIVLLDYTKYNSSFYQSTKQTNDTNERDAGW